MSFNPHARVGRDFQQLQLPDWSYVSIHTPVWGVTRSRSFALLM